jgi:hypothetical protein
MVGAPISVEPRDRYEHGDEHVVELCNERGQAKCATWAKFPDLVRADPELSKQYDVELFICDRGDESRQIHARSRLRATLAHAH